MSNKHNNFCRAGLQPASQKNMKIKTSCETPEMQGQRFVPRSLKTHFVGDFLKWNLKRQKSFGNSAKRWNKGSHVLWCSGVTWLNATWCHVMLWWPDLLVANLDNLEVPYTNEPMLSRSSSTSRSFFGSKDALRFPFCSSWRRQWINKTLRIWDLAGLLINQNK